jgi:hypothetical protein
MYLATWFRQTAAPETSPRVEGLVLRTAQYLSSKPSTEEFVPKIVGAALSESELAAMTALSILEKRGITQHHFGVYCGNKGVPLDSYDDLKRLPNDFRCETCDDDHSVSEGTCKIEIYFTVDRDRLARFTAKASAA